MNIHVVAVSGTGMGSLAGLLKELGHVVSGSDVAFDPPMGPALEQWGIRCLRGFDARHLEPAPDLVVVGNYCRGDNVEVRAALERGLRVTHIAGALRELVLAGTSPLVVAGTHGKTTTTSLAAWLLEASNFGPGFLVGGIPKNFGRSFRSARGPARRLPLIEAETEPERPERQHKPAFVLEGDEYDTAFFEKTAKFLHYGAEVAIVTSIEHDHVDIYPTEAGYLEAFRRFVAGVPEHGLIVANAADETVVSVVQAAARAPISWYALAGQDTHGAAPHWLAAPAAVEGGVTTFDLFAGGSSCGRLALSAVGSHNLENALAALAAAAEGYGAPLDEIGPALARFAGVRRRQELLGEPAGVLVYDDFAHHPTAVERTLFALRLRHPQGRLFAVFEPRSATACRRTHQAAYAASFDSADEVLLAPLGRSNLPPEERLDLGLLTEELAARGKHAEHLQEVDSIIARVAERAAPGDVVAILSNGAFGGVQARLLSTLEAREGPASVLDKGDRDS
jgi:UDP-N-acetylmuramate: L-alanyl-gamma-D-glutamyl-meso-diaminopimelate ligase